MLQVSLGRKRGNSSPAAAGCSIAQPFMLSLQEQGPSCSTHHPPPLSFPAHPIPPQIPAWHFWELPWGRDAGCAPAGTALPTLLLKLNKTSLRVQQFELFGKAFKLAKLRRVVSFFFFLVCKSSTCYANICLHPLQQFCLEEQKKS